MGGDLADEKARFWLNEADAGDGMPLEYFGAEFEGCALEECTSPSP